MWPMFYTFQSHFIPAWRPRILSCSVVWCENCVYATANHFCLKVGSWWEPLIFLDSNSLLFPHSQKLYKNTSVLGGTVLKQVLWAQLSSIWLIVFLFFFLSLNPIYTTEKIGKARIKIGKGNFHFRQGKGKMCSVNSESLSCLANLFFGFGTTSRGCPVLKK